MYNAFNFERLFQNSLIIHKNDPQLVRLFDFKQLRIIFNDI